jgi:hypothetical protein
MKELGILNFVPRQIMNILSQKSRTPEYASRTPKGLRTTGLITDDVEAKIYIQLTMTVICEASDKNPGNNQL